MNQKKSVIWGIVVLTIIVLVVLGFIFDIGRKQPINTSIVSFETCIASGNTIIEAYPPQCETADGRVFVSAVATTTVSLQPSSSPQSDTASSTATTTITTIDAYSVITSPLVIKGSAPGAWYSEAVFPIKIADAYGTIIGVGSAEAQADWMTANSVPFKATVVFKNSTTATGTIILMNDNPSGDPQKSEEITLPIRFMQ